MKNILKIQPQKDARGLLIGLILILVIAFIVNLFTGCGDDNVTNSNNNPTNEVLIYSQDSLALTTPPFTKDTNINFSNVSSIKIKFTGETNADSVNGFSLFTVTVYDTVTNTIIFDLTYNAVLHMNQDFEFSQSSIVNPCTVMLKIQCIRNPPFVFYMKLKNIKIYKIN